MAAAERPNMANRGGLTPGPNVVCLFPPKPSCLVLAAVDTNLGSIYLPRSGIIKVGSGGGAGGGGLVGKVKGGFSILI